MDISADPNPYQYVWQYVRRFWRAWCRTIYLFWRALHVCDCEESCKLLIIILQWNISFCRLFTDWPEHNKNVIVWREAVLRILNTIVHQRLDFRVADPRCLSRILHFSIPDSGSASKNLRYLTKKLFCFFKLLEVWSGLFIPEPDPDFLPIPDPGSKGQKGTGSATLTETTCTNLDL